MHRYRYVRVALVMVLAISLGLFDLASGYTGPKRVLILPFKLNAPQDLTYLQQGIYDMLSSRIEYGDQVSVVSRAEAHQAFQKTRGNVNEGVARTLGNDLNVDYVLFGSITVIGQNFSLDATMLDLKGSGPPVAIHDQSTGMDGVIPKINRFAEQINQTVFGRASSSGPSVQAYGSDPSAPEPRRTEPLPAYRRHPDYLLTGKEGQLGSNPLNPNFISEGGPGFAQQGFWKSPTFQLNITGLDVGDIDGDNLNEIVYSDTTTVYVVRLENQRLIQVAHYEGIVSNHIKTLDLADLNGNGIPEIFITCQDNKRAQSVILEMRGGRLVPLVQGFPYYMRKLHLADGPVIVGQKSGVSDTFYGGIKVIGYSGGQYVVAGNIGTPPNATVFNFAQADLEGNGQNCYVLVDGSNRLHILSPSGEIQWSSKKKYCGTSISLFKTRSGFTSDDLGSDKDHMGSIFIPSPILIEDLNKDGKKEIIVSHNEESVAAKLLTRYRNYKHSSMNSLSYGQLSVRENWRTRELTGGVVDYCIKDYNNNGTPDLLMALVRSKGTTLTDAKSTLVGYEVSGKE